MRFFIKNSLKSCLFLLCLSAFVVTMLSENGIAQEDGVDKHKVVRQVAREWIKAGIKQYQQGFYKQAEKSFLYAQDYHKYLTAAEREELAEYLKKAHKGAVERTRILEHIQRADKLVKEGNLIEAKRNLEDIQDNEFLTDKERKLTSESIKKITSKLGDEAIEVDEKPLEIKEVLKVESTVLDKLKIEEEAEEPTEPLIIEKEPVVVQPTESVQENYIQMISRKRNLLRGHTKAVVNDAIDKARQYIGEGEFSKAQKSVDNAKRTVTQNQLHLGDGLYKQYLGSLNELRELIADEQEQKERQLAEERRLSAIKAQEKYRTRMSLERSRRINELMDNALAFQKQQRHEEALGQLEGLLAIEPLNEQALIFKDTLEDTISFRRQLEAQKEANTQKVELLLKTDRSTIPYAEELNYPKNWREIDATRKSEEAMGVNPLDEAIYTQLAEIVDLSGLEPEMSFSEALEELRNSVSPRLKVLVIWNDLLQNAEIEQTTTANMDPISEIPLVTGLEFLLDSVSGGITDIGYVVENGVIKIATTESLQENLETRVYDVTILIGRPADFFSSLSRGGTGGGQVGGGGGGGGAGGGGTGGQYFEEYIEEEEEALTREELSEEALERAENLMALVQETIEPDSWFDAGGEGTIRLYEGKKLVVRQTRKIHKQIEQLLKDMRKSLSEQVAIEARFLLVGENFLEDIGLDIDFELNSNLDWGSSSAPFTITQNSAVETEPADTGIPGSFAGTVASVITGGYGSMLDDLQVSFLLRATQAHKDSKTLTEPKVTVLSGESAVFRTQRTIRYALPPDISTSITTLGGGGAGTNLQNIQNNFNEIPTGTILNVTPTITHDKKHVLLNITTQKIGFLGFETSTIEIPDLETGTVFEQQIDLPQTEISRVQTRVSVPDGGTLLLGGQKVTSEVEEEVGVPLLNKIPIIGRLFDNRSKIKDNQILLILVKPTIILETETDAAAIAAMKN